MSMLADRKRPQKWSDDPNGLRWAQDNNSFGRKMLEKMGWQGGGLGKLEDGKKDFVRVSVKNDCTGVGCVQKSDRETLITLADGLDDVLSSLKGTSSTSNQASSNEPSSYSLVQASKERGTRFHYKRMVAAKDVKHRMDEVIFTSKSDSDGKSSKKREIVCDADVGQCSGNDSFFTPSQSFLEENNHEPDCKERKKKKKKRSNNS